jgi:hypothetical protein
LRKVGTSAEMTEYRLRLDGEGAAIIDAAIDPLARPRPDLGWSAETDTDPRAADTRRADALLELVGRAVAAPQGQTRTPRTKLVVTISYQALLEQLRGAGVTDNDAVLSPATVRRLACEAAIIPLVLGSPSQVLDEGYHERYFTPAQRIVLARRDKGCSFPGCTVPPQWCEAHHITHWLHGGETNINNGALLCGRHHTIVHNKDMTAVVTPHAVTWLHNDTPVQVGMRGAMPPLPLPNSEESSPPDPAPASAQPEDVTDPPDLSRPPDLWDSNEWPEPPPTSEPFESPPWPRLASSA